MLHQSTEITDRRCMKRLSVVINDSIRRRSLLIRCKLRLAELCKCVYTPTPNDMEIRTTMAKKGANVVAPRIPFAIAIIKC